MTQPNTLFVWRRVSDPPWIDLGSEGVGPHACPCCVADLRRSAHDEWDDDYAYTPVVLSCHLCGWEISYEVHGTYVDPYKPLISYSIHSITGLKEFATDATELALEELGTYLKRNFASIYDMSWRRFEELLADVFTQHGFRTVLTQPSKDGGADLLLLNHDSGQVSAIVEAKHYAPHRRLDVRLVRQLVGAAVAWDVRRAFLVTTSDFTADAKVSANNYKGRGYEVDLVAASDLLLMLNVYNARLPRLENLTSDQR